MKARGRRWRVLLWLLPLLLFGCAWGWLEFRNTGYFSRESRELPKAVTSFELGTRAEVSDVLLCNVRLFVSSRDSVLRAFEPDGRPLWSQPCSFGQYWAHLAAFPDGPVCVYDGGNVACWSRDGEPLWVREELYAEPDRKGDGSRQAGLLFVFDGGDYSALDSRGQIIWSDTTPKYSSSIISAVAPDAAGNFSMLSGRGYDGVFLKAFNQTGELAQSRQLEEDTYWSCGWPYASCQDGDGNTYAYTRGELGSFPRQGVEAKLFRVAPDGAVDWAVRIRAHTEYARYGESEIPDWGGDSVYIVDEGRLKKVRKTDGEATFTTSMGCGRIVMFCYSGDRQLFAVATNMSMSQDLSIYSPRRRFQLIQLSPELEPVAIYRLPTRGVQRVWASPRGLYIRSGSRLQEYVFPPAGH